MKKKPEGRATIADLQFDQNNANKGTPRGRGLLEKSLQQCGAGRSVLIDKNNRLIAGNKTIETAGEVGMTKVRIVDTDGSEIIAVRRTDLDLNVDKKARELAVLDNRVGEVDLEWNPETIKQMVDDSINLNEIGFTKTELENIIGTSDKTVPGAELPEMELGPWEKYDYVVIVAKNEIDLNRIHTLLDIKKEKCSFSKSVVKTGTGRVVSAERLFSTMDQFIKLSKRPI
jgi:hypothetical protein